MHDRQRVVSPERAMTNEIFVQVAAVVNQGNLLPDQYVLQVCSLSAHPDLRLVAEAAL